MRIINASETKSENSFNIWDAHLELAVFNKFRFQPKFPSGTWRSNLAFENKFAILEGEMLEYELKDVDMHLRDFPKTPNAFFQWFYQLKSTGPGQKSSFFQWLETSITRPQLQWLLRQEIICEAGLDDVIAMVQVQLPTRPKLELAKNYWDQMGRGQEMGIHTELLKNIAEDLGFKAPNLAEVIPEALAKSNLLWAMAANRRFAYHAIGALAVLQLITPDRAMSLQRALKRLNMGVKTQQYYLLHSTLNGRNTINTLKGILLPLIAEVPDAMPLIAEGALLQMNASARCIERYQQQFSQHYQ